MADGLNTTWLLYHLRMYVAAEIFTEETLGDNATRRILVGNFASLSKERQDAYLAKADERAERFGHALKLRKAEQQ